MPKLILKSGYTKDIQHFVNNLEYAGNKIAEQHVTFTNGKTQVFDGCEKLNFDKLRRENIAAIYLKFKDGDGRTVSVESYENKMKSYKTVTVERVIEETPDKEITEAKMPRELQELSFFSYMSYVGERPGAVKENGCGLFSLTGDIPSGEAEILARSDDFTRGWMHIISMDAADAQRLGYDNRAAWRDLAISKAPEIAKAYNISLENLRFYGGFHANTDNPHVHINFYSKNKSEGFVTDLEKASKKVKSLFTNAIFKDDVSEIKQAINHSRDEMAVQLSRAMALDRVNENYQKKLLEIASTLPTNGKKHYQFMPPQTKTLIGSLLQAILQDETIQPIYDRYIGAHEDYAKVYADNPEVIERQKLSAHNKLLGSTDTNSWRRLHNIIVQSAYEVKERGIPKPNYAPQPSEFETPLTPTPNLDTKQTFEFQQLLEEVSKDESPIVALMNKWGEINIEATEQSVALVAQARKQLHKVLSNSILTDKSEISSEIRQLLENDTPAQEIFTKAVKADTSLSETVSSLLTELNGKLVDEQKNNVSSEMLEKYILLEGKANSLQGYAKWCQKNYVIMAASQLKTHCKHLNKPIGRHVLKTLDANFKTILPDLLEIHSINRRIDEIQNTETEKEPLKKEDIEKIKSLNAKRKTYIKSINKECLYDDKYFEKYKQKVFAHTGKHFRDDLIPKVNKRLNDDFMNGSPYSPPGSYISFFADNLPNYYLKILCKSDEMKPQKSALYKELTESVYNAILNEPKFASDLQELHRLCTEKSDYSVDSLYTSLFHSESALCEKESEFLTALQISLKQNVPESLQAAVLKEVDLAQQEQSRSLPQYNMLHHFVKDYPETLSKAVLSKNERLEEFRIEVNKVILQELYMPAIQQSESTFYALMCQLKQASDEAKPDIKKALLNETLERPAVADAVEKLWINFSAKYEEISSHAPERQMFDNLILNDKFIGSENTFAYFSEIMDSITKAAHSNQLQNAALHMVKGIASALYAGTQKNQADLSNTKTKLNAQGELTKKIGNLSSRKTNDRGVMDW